MDAVFFSSVAIQHIPYTINETTHIVPTSKRFEFVNIFIAVFNIADDKYIVPRFRKFYIDYYIILKYMNQKSRDVLLAILSIGGIFYIVGRIYGSIIDIIKTSINLTILKYLVISESLLFLICGLLIWKKIKLSEDYSKYFIILFVIGLIFDFVYKLVVIF